MATVLTYNGITLELIKTNVIARTPIYSSDGVDYLYTHWTINISAVYNPGATSYTTGPTSSNDAFPTPTDVNIRHLLSLPRGSLVLSCGPDNILTVNGLDANNGPIPKKIDIRRIIGTQTFLVDYEIECWVNECPNGSGNTAPTLLSNRWQVTDSIDDNFITTKVTRGIASYRTDMLVAAGNSPDHFRNAALPPIPLGFKRIHIQATMHPSLNSMSYEVVDQEQRVYIGDQHKSFGVTKFEGFFSESTTSGTEGGAASGLAAGEVTVRVWGERDTSNWNLTLFAIRIVFQKLQLDGAAKDVPVLRSIAVRQAIHDRYVEMSASVLIAPNNGNNGISLLNIVSLNMDDLAIFVKDFTNPQPYDKGSRGSHQWEMVAQKFKDSCGKASALLNPLQTQSTDTPYDSTTPTKVNIGISNSIPYYQANRYSSNVYSDYRIDVKYQTDYMNVHAPVANSGTIQASSVMTLASPITKKIISWTAERMGDQPAIPNAQPGDQNLTLLSAEIQPATPGIMADTNTEIYRVSGTYIYAMKTPLGATDTLKTGALPWTTLGLTDGQYSNWQGGILDIGSGSGSSSGSDN